MKVTIGDLMVTKLVTTTPDETVGDVGPLMRRRRIGALPVVDAGGEPVGIVTRTDLLEEVSSDTPVSEVMSTKLLTVPDYEDPSVAARIMRNHDFHHLVVTQDGSLRGIVSTFDLLRLIEDRRFVMKNPPTPRKRGGPHRRKSELRLGKSKPSYRR